MKTPAAAPDPNRMDPQLAAHLHTVAARLRATRLHRLGMWRWLGVAVLTLGLLQLRAQHEELTSFTAGALALLFAAGALLEILVRRRTPYDYAAAARIVEHEFPDLRLALHTAAEQAPEEAGGRFHFLQRKVIDDTLRHARRNPWTLRT